MVPVGDYIVGKTLPKAPPTPSHHATVAEKKNETMFKTPLKSFHPQFDVEVCVVLTLYM